MDIKLDKLAILYADVSGSTRIYEKFGDAVAREAIRACIEILTDVSEQYDGHVVKTIGDEVMCAFGNPLKAALAAAAMHEALQLASEQGRFSCGALHVKIGWHYGTIHHRGHEIIGEAPVIAQQIIRKARADEILTSEQSIHELPDELRVRARRVDSIEAEAYAGQVIVYAQAWEDEEDTKEQVTRYDVRAVDVDETTRFSALMLEYNGMTLWLDADHTHCSIGRGAGNDLRVSGKFTSKLHAEITFRNGNFNLHDMSTNGTDIIFDNGEARRVHREEMFLHQHGTICFGGLPEVDPAAAVHFKCIRKGEA
jgi:adenylate cyclase